MVDANFYAVLELGEIADRYPRREPHRAERHELSPLRLRLV